MKKRFGLAVILVLIAALVLSLSGCEFSEEILGNSGIEEEKQVPVYQGMTITKGKLVTGTGHYYNDVTLFAGSGNNGNGNGNNNGDNGNHNGHYKGDHEDKDEELDEENPYPDNDQNENIEEEIESSLKVIGSPDTVYYANPNQDIYINIHISNPDDFEIMSFTLNGKKYSSYMFEDGSDMETIILKYNVGNASGIVEYTIDAIKYIDGTEIKDVIIDGDTTVKAGIKVDDQVTATVKDLAVHTNEVSFSVNLRDNDKLIAHSNGTAKAVLYDGEEIVDIKDIKTGNNSVTFTNLKTNTVYQYAIVASYDDLSGKGVDMHILYVDAFRTESVVLFSDINLTQESISFGFAWHESREDKALSALKLYKDGALVSDLAVDTTEITDLLSGNTYELIAEYVNGESTESIYLEFTTAEKTAPTIEIINASSTQTSVSFEIVEADIDEVGAITKIELVHGENVIEAESLDLRTFADLLSGNTYKVRVTYVYNLNDGNGAQTIITECDIETLAKTVPQVEINSVEITLSEISVDCNFADIDSVLSSCIAEFYKGEELIAQNSDGSISFEFSENAKYTIRILYTYDLNDGKGIQTAVSSQDVYTGFTVTADNRTWIGYTGEANENLVIPATFEHDGAWYRVTSIGDNAFFECKSLVSVTIPNTVTSIGQQSFIYCEALTTVVIPEGVTTIDSLAFCFCGNLTNVTIPSTVENLGRGAFKGAQMTSVVIPDGVTNIPASLFEWNESLQSITIPASVTSIDGGVFYYNKLLTTITFSGTVEQWNSIFKTEGWDELSGDYTITCTDGIICKTHKYESVTNDQTSTQNGYVKYTCSGCGDSYIKTLPYVDVINCQIINTSAISEGETIYMQIALTNPDSVNVDSIVINGRTYNVTSSSTATKLFVEIVYEGQFEGGDTYLSVDKLNATFDGINYIVEPEVPVGDNVFINGKIEVINIEFVNENFEPIYYSLGGSRVFVLLTLDNPTGYHIDDMKHEGFTSSAPQKFTKIDDNHWYYEYGWNWEGGMDEVTKISIESISYSNEHIQKTMIVHMSSSPIMLISDETPIYISTPEDLKKMSATRYYVLTNDIDLSGMEWIGSSFNGVFEGNGYSIKNMSFVGTNDGSTTYLGLFSSANGIINNLNIENAIIISADSCTAGFFAGTGSLIMENCNVDANSILSVEGTAGGFIGNVVGRASFSNCVNRGNVSGDCAGGFIGNRDQLGEYFEFLGCINYGEISATYTSGGFIGSDYSYVVDSVFVNCLNNGNVKSGQTAGGYIGYYGASVNGNLSFTNCINNGDISVYEGIENVYSNEAGGFVGYSSGQDISFVCCINTGKIASQKNTGGLIGNVFDYSSKDIIIMDSYSLYCGNGINSENSTIDQLNSKSFYTETLGWSEDVWDFSELDVENGKYPKLKK